MKPETKYYDFDKLVSYNADVSIVIGARGLGKTYGARRKFVRDYLKNGARFVEITRYRNELSALQSDWFGKLTENNEFESYMFRTQANVAYISKKPDAEHSKPEWSIIGYFVALSMQAAAKKLTYVNVRNIMMDEITIDANDKWHRYLPNEFEQLANLVDTVTRERADTVSKMGKPRVFLLGNACDMFNPYFAHYGINTMPEYGVRWYGDKTMILDYVQNETYARGKKRDTVAGRMLGNSNAIGADNRFIMRDDHMLENAHAHANITYVIVYKNEKYAIINDYNCAKVFISNKYNKNSNVTEIALTLADGGVNRLTEKWAREIMKSLREYLSIGALRFDTMKTQNAIESALRLYGVK